MINSFDQIKRVEDLYQLNTYAKLPISIERGEGVWVYDSDGNRYLDLYGGHAVALTGHCHPRVVSAVQEQVKKLIFYSNVVYSSVRAKASRELIEVAPKGMDKVFFCNSGAESNETALKVARRFTGKKTIVAMKGGFHGRTAGALSATSLGDYRKQFLPLLGGFRFITFGEENELKILENDDIAGVILEPIQSMAGVEMAQNGYYQKLRDICTERNIVLIFDEVQTGLGRTGSWFFGDGVGVVPDIITLAKGIGGGIPIGAVIIAGHITKTIGHGEHGSTFGGGPVACAALSASIGVIRDEKLVQNARMTGEYLKEKLRNIPIVKGVKGKGLLVGIEIEVGSTAKQVRDKLLRHGIITGSSLNTQVLRILAPLVLKKNEVDLFIRALEEQSLSGRK